MAVATAPSKQKKQREKGQNALGRALGYLKRYPKLAGFALFALLAATAAQLAVPAMVQQAIDSVLDENKLATQPLSATETALLTFCVAIVGLALARGIFAFAQSYSSQVLSQDIAFELRNDIFAKIQRLSFSYHDKNRTGQLMIRATDDVEKLRTFIGQGSLIAIQALLLLVGSLAAMISSSPSLTLIISPIIPLAMIIFGAFGRIAQPLFGEVQRRLAAVNTVLEENLSGLKVVKAFARESDEYDRFAVRSSSLLEQRIKINKIFSIIFPSFFLLVQLGTAAILYFGGRQIINDTLSVGQWQAFNLYLVLLFFPMGQLGFIIGQIAQASASANRVFEILDTKNDVEEKADAITLPPLTGQISFSDVGFRYFSSSDDVLKGLTFSAESGQTVALLGTTGSGKTTVINLIPRFYDVTEGSITLDGHDIRDVTLESLREQIGIVLQETTLFTGSIRENIAFGRPDASQDEIEAAAKASAAHDFIIGFPDGYDTAVGERGSTLSGGQKQRIAIARALLLDPRILIMDDSTSAVDYETEFRIQQALDKLMQGRTSIVIAQRISTVLSADQILILDKGKIVERGTHHQLLENSAIYAEIYHSQLAE